jgi:hypothetical protein
MIRFGFRLALCKDAAARLVITAAAVALGVGLLLITLAGINATNAQNGRYAWLNTGAGGIASGPNSASPNPLWWLVRADHFAGRLVGRVEVAATGPASPVPPGIPRLPGPGQFYASPALSALIRTTPPAQLGDRFPGHQIGTIGRAALPAPDSLVIVIGDTPGRLARTPGVKQVTSIATIRPSSCPGCQIGMNANTIDLILSVVAGALVFPVIILIATATRLAATRREQRFAAMRLGGATPRQVTIVSAVESAAAAVAGTAAGFGLFFLLRSPIAAIPFTGEPFFPSDLSLRLTDVLLAAAGVPVIATVAALLTLRRVKISPLGVRRRSTPPAPRAYRLLPLAAGVAELGYFIGRRPPTTSGQIRAYLPGFVLIMAGLVIAGPWLTMAASRLVARRTGHPATLIAARRLSDNPQAGFRAVSGLVLALFVTTVAVGVITTIKADSVVSGGGAAATSTLVEDLTHAAKPTAALIARLHSIPGVSTVAVTRQQIVVTTNETTSAVEQARTTIELAYPGRVPPSTASESKVLKSRRLTSYQQLAEVVILVSLTIAGCSLAVSLAGAVSDRKRPFSLLRLTGVPLVMLRRVIAMETVVPLLAVAVVAVGTGFLAAALFLKSQMDYALHPPGAEYYVTVLAGLAVSIGLIASTLPLLNRITGPETARNE